ncbi:hypothetical protein A1E_00545 [Rickettsia canadensis str. McKiel]|uniref:Uncharacterized protein n=1 Tax=Rickettsia canadensis (strain McKiel) TaxID=293613 RepID=A8EXH4_RICCK|nr:hypothetical protein A1E_00545 [Rickettsia canadensis str. McKiel]
MRAKQLKYLDQAVMTGIVLETRRLF